MAESTTESTRAFESWEATEVAAWLKTKDLGQYEETFITNNINGNVAPNLTEANLAEMGVSVVGDRIRIIQALNTLKKSQVQHDREKIIWEGEEVLYFSCFDRCCSTCCGCCPVEPSQYKLRSNVLEIKTITPCRCGPVNCCCGSSYEIDNVDLSNVQDTDVHGVPPSCLNQTCCCGATQEHLHVQTTNDEDDKILKLGKGEGQKVARTIKNQVETMQRMERSN
jgi:hypothetical protein